MLVGYARVSTLDQSPALQIDALRAAGSERIFTETASGADAGRPELAAALDYLRPGDTIVVWKLDRLARSLPQLPRTIELLHETDVGLLCLTQPIETTTPAGRLVFQIFSAISEFERSRTRERTLAGLEAARTRGQKLGRPTKLDDKKLRAAAAMLRDPAIPVRDVAKQLDVSVSTLYRHLPAARVRFRSPSA